MKLLARRLGLAARALLFIALPLVAYASLAASGTTLKALSGITLHYPTYIRLTNCFVAVICGAFLVWPKESGRLVGNWNRYVGLAFFSFSVQYALRFISIVLGGRLPDYGGSIGAVMDVGVYVASYLNSIFILAAARILLNKNRRVPAATAAEGLRGWPRLRQEWAALRNALPDWYLWLFPLTLIALLEELERLPPGLLRSWLRYDFLYLWVTRSLLFVRFPEAVFSVYCLSWFAYAVWLNFYVRRRGAMAWLGFALVLAYAAGQLVFASNPFIARSLSDPALDFFPATTIRSYLEPKVSEDLREKVNSENAQIDKENRDEAAAREGIRPEGPRRPTQFVKVARDYFDGAIFAVLFPMKPLLFLPAFVLYLLMLSSGNNFRQVLHEMTNERKDYLSRDGILDVIGRSMGADEVELLIRVPGVNSGRAGGVENVISEVWRSPCAPARKERARRFALDDDPLLVRAMQTEGREIIITGGDEGAAAAGLRESDPAPQTLVVVPVRFHGGVIGVLQVVFRGYGKYNDGMLEQLKFMAEMIAPLVQDFRTVSAVDKLGPRLSRAQAGKPGAISGQGERRADTFERATEKMGRTLYDLLNPLAVGIHLRCGFTEVSRAHAGEEFYYDIFRSPKVGYVESPGRPGGGEQDDAEAQKRRYAGGWEDQPVVVQTERGPVKVERDYLIVRTEKAARFNLGTLFLAIPADRDEFSRPTLAAYYLTRRAVASQTAHGIFNAAHNSLGLLIQDLGVALNRETLSAAEWFARVEVVVRRAGLLWAVASEGDGRPTLGRPEHAAVVDGLDATARHELTREQEQEPLGCVPHHDAQTGTRHVIHVRLKGAGHLWLGVARAQFGPELNFKSPWKVFLLNLASVAGTALVRIEEQRREEEERVREEARRLREADDEGMKKFADLNAAVMHQLVNMTRNMLGITHILEIASSKPDASDVPLPTAVRDMKTNLALMLGVAAAYREIIRGDGSGSCDIAEAARLAERLFRFGLDRRGIDLRIDVRPGAVANAPSYLVALSMASLIGNAIDAMPAGGRITISAAPEEDEVLCHVFNDGPPIPPDIMPNLFRPVPKGKSGHSGHGLYLVLRSLENYGGGIQLAYSDSKGTCFTLRLPKSKNLSANG